MPMTVAVVLVVVVMLLVVAVVVLLVVMTVVALMMTVVAVGMVLFHGRCLFLVRVTISLAFDEKHCGCVLNKRFSVGRIEYKNLKNINIFKPIVTADSFFV
jgi:hypothetical protein